MSVTYCFQSPQSVQSPLTSQWLDYASQIVCKKSDPISKPFVTSFYFGLKFYFALLSDILHVSFIISRYVAI